MERASVKLKIKGNKSSYGIYPWRGENLITAYDVGSKKLDKRYLLITDTLEEKNKIFGIADTPEEANKRTYEKAIELADKFQKKYKREWDIEIIDQTKKPRNLESKV